MRREMEREFEDTFKNIETKAPKDLVREYERGECIKRSITLGLTDDI